MQFGFIGQGYIGKNMADDFEERGHAVVRYALEEEYQDNKDKISECDVVFIAVPTPSKEIGSDSSLVEELIELTGPAATVIIKSTVTPGTTSRIQAAHPERVVLFSPEFLSKVSAAEDARQPIMNVIGVPTETAAHRRSAEQILSVLPPVEHQFIVAATAAETFKYVHNVHGFVRIVLSNLFYDLAEKQEVDWGEIIPMIAVDPMMSSYYNQPVHKSGRGAGGCCFIKDFLAFRSHYAAELTDDKEGIAVLEALEKKNLELLAKTNKDQDIVSSVYEE